MIRFPTKFGGSLSRASTSHIRKFLAYSRYWLSGEAASILKSANLLPAAPEPSKSISIRRSRGTSREAGPNRRSIRPAPPRLLLLGCRTSRHVLRLGSHTHSFRHLQGKLVCNRQTHKTSRRSSSNLRRCTALLQHLGSPRQTKESLVLSVGPRRNQHKLVKALAVCEVQEEILP